MRLLAGAIAVGWWLAVASGAMHPAAADMTALTGDGAANSFGDDRLSYQHGVVYDDDLVPGRGPNQPYLVDEQAGNRGSGAIAVSPATTGRAVASPQRAWDGR